ncbi:bifunctional phosphoribosylaminoimidazolecarboxamide formyltransferase/IMP cyclohydrolase [Candidatus Sumerlaeota bacterium]|nr:bifunctional phosphoribosylaminoimidazolecarboxamide formyltransferase/IMP cyclohydrolase [Candidatus Sumerlaeota bacterium]
MDMTKKIQRAVLSVSDKTGLVDFAKELAKLGVELVSTGGTMKALQKAGLAVKSVSDMTDFPEILDGRVKTLHPAVFSGILARRNRPDDMDILEKLSLPIIDMIVVNLYPFEKVSSNPEATFAEAIENIDIGGPSMLRAAAKNFEDVAVLCSPDQYDVVIEELGKTGGNLTRETRVQLARKVFEHTSYYDSRISSYLWSKEPKGEDRLFPERFTLHLNKISDLRYGENPHQNAAYYKIPDEKETSIPRSGLLHGKPLSYNNIADLDTALDCIRDFEETAAVILKHANPCGLAVADSQVEAYKLARDCDPVSAFGGIVGLNRPCDAGTAGEISKTFIECVIAPSFTPEALEILTAKKNIRLLESGEFTPKKPEWLVKSIVGGALVQDRDLGEVKEKDLKVVSKAQPVSNDIKALLFAWKVVKWVKSNAIVYTTKNAAAGIGAGQMSRVDAAELGVKKALKSLQGLYMASDAFFPFRDSVDAAAKAGVRAIIEPGGSVRDEEVIQAADEHGLILVFTGMRHFRH